MISSDPRNKDGVDWTETTLIQQCILHIVFKLAVNEKEKHSKGKKGSWERTTSESKAQRRTCSLYLTGGNGLN